MYACIAFSWCSQKKTKKCNQGWVTLALHNLSLFPLGPMWKLCWTKSLLTSMSRSLPSPHKAQQALPPNPLSAVLALWRQILHVRLPLQSVITSHYVCVCVANILRSPSQVCPAPVRQQNACMCNFWPRGLMNEKKQLVCMCVLSTCANMFVFFPLSLIRRCVRAWNALCFWIANLWVVSGHHLRGGSEVTPHIVPIWKPLLQLGSTKAGHTEPFCQACQRLQSGQQLCLQTN